MTYLWEYWMFSSDMNAILPGWVSLRGRKGGLSMRRICLQPFASTRCSFRMALHAEDAKLNIEQKYELFVCKQIKLALEVIKKVEISKTLFSKALLLE